MNESKREDRVRIRLFKTDWLERNTLTSFRLFASVWLMLLGAAFGVAVLIIPLKMLLPTVLAGFGCWFLFEYAMHRYIFHLQPRSALLKRLIFLLHENHHEDPADPLRGLMPLSLSLPVALLLSVVISGLGLTAEAMLLGFVSGYVLYDAVHWACHHRPMTSAIGMQLKRHHLRHHYAVPERNFAVTAIFLDRWFGTSQRRN